MLEYLAETEFLDISSSEVQSTIQQLNLRGMNNREKAVRIFEYVRDSTKYSIKGVGVSPDLFKASTTLRRDNSFCIPKAVTLCTLARAVGIPSRLHFVDFINHRLTPELVELWGTNVMASHCYSELYIDGKWVKATPALDRKTCDAHRFITPEFDGENDALLSPVDKDGNPHVEYIKDHGTYADVPLDMIVRIFEENYGDISSEFVKKIFSENVDTFT